MKSLRSPDGCLGLLLWSSREGRVWLLQSVASAFSVLIGNLHVMFHRAWDFNHVRAQLYMGVNDALESLIKFIYVCRLAFPYMHSKTLQAALPPSSLYPDRTGSVYKWKPTKFNGLKEEKLIPLFRGAM